MGIAEDAKKRLQWLNRSKESLPPGLFSKDEIDRYRKHLEDLATTVDARPFSDMATLTQFEIEACRRFGVDVQFVGTESGRAYLSDATRSIQLFGPPRVSVDCMIDWIAHWIRRGHRTLGKPTHFEVTDGQFLTDSSK